MDAFRWVLVAVAALVLGVTSAGIGVRATYGAQTTADEPQYLLTALSIWEDFSLDISDELTDRRYEAFHEVELPRQTRALADGRRVSPHDVLLPIILAVPMGLGGWVGAKLALAAMAALLAALLVWVAHRRFDVSPWVGGAVVSVFALSPPLAVYATQVYPEIVAALAVTAAIAALTSKPSPGSVVALTCALVALPWLAVKYVPLALVLALSGFLWLPGHQRGRWALALVALGGFYVGIHLWLYEGLTAYAAGDHFVGGEFTAVGTDVSLWGRSTRLLGLLIDRGFGLAPWQLAYLFVVVAVGWWTVQRRTHRMLLLSVVATGWLTATFVALTMHGWWFPGRQVVVIAPALVLVVATWCDRNRLRTGLVLGVGIVGVGSFAALVAEGLAGRLTWIIDFATVPYLPYRVLAPFFPDYMQTTGHTWLLHGAWIVVLAAAALFGRSHGQGSHERAGRIGEPLVAPNRKETSHNERQTK